MENILNKEPRFNINNLDEKILEVKNLNIIFNTYFGKVNAIRNMSFDLYRGETLAFVGESGCGKTVTAKSILRLLKEPFAVIDPSSKILYNNRDVLKMSEKELNNNYRGEEVSMIFQDPMTSLNPTMTIGKQIIESLVIHKKLDKKKAKEEAMKLLELVNISDASSRINYYPHQISGGMRQRIMIAIALSCNPNILIADEPTTALDVTIQAQILDLLKDLKDKFNTAIILVTHDLGIVSNFANRIQVMYAGEIVERSTKKELFFNSQHPYTWALLKSIPKLDSNSKERLYSLKGTPPDLTLPIKGCVFSDRCEYCMKICKEEKPYETKLSETHIVSCWLQHPNAPKINRVSKKEVE